MILKQQKRRYCQWEKKVKNLLNYVPDVPKLLGGMEAEEAELTALLVLLENKGIISSVEYHETLNEIYDWIKDGSK